MVFVRGGVKKHKITSHFQGPHSYGVLTFIESGVCLSVGLSASHPLLMGCEKSSDKSLDY